MDIRETIIKTIEKKGILEKSALWKEVPAQKAAILKEIGKLADAGEIVHLGKGRVAALAKANYLKGEILVKKDGYGFVRNDKGDVFVAKKDMNGVFPGETVLVKLMNKGEKDREGKITRILSPLPYRTVGTYKSAKKGDYVLADDPVNGKIAVPEKYVVPHAHNKKVVVAVTKRADAKKNTLPEGQITEVLGPKGAPRIDILSIARSFGLYAEFPKNVEKEALALGDTVGKKDLADRELLFDKRVFTIDGVDSKDLDDAVSIERLPNGNSLLGVHIADVAHYVPRGSELDKEAYKRGTSVYLVEQVVPMLPKKLSNGICSLNEKTVRLTLSCFMEVDKSGRVVKYRFAKTAIKSCHRLNYTEINRLLEAGDPSVKNKYADIAKDLYQLRDLAKVLEATRTRGGSIDFDIPEAKIELDAQGRPVKIIPREQRTAENLIEECMVLCNNTVAEEFAKDNALFLYRIHEKPSADKMRALSIFLSTFGYRHVNNTNKSLQNILKKSTGTPAEGIIRSVVLRSMQKAIYSTGNAGHFGLGSSAYTHFTSPIRRYPDLVVHRLLHEKLRGEKMAYPHLGEVAEHCSARERNAINAERKIDDIMKAKYMQNHIGERFTGVVSGVTPSVLFVQLPDTVEGVLPLAEIKEDYYLFYKDLYCVVGRRTKKKISLGDTIAVRVKAVDPELARIEFSAAAPVSKRRKK